MRRPTLLASALGAAALAFAFAAPRPAAFAVQGSTDYVLTTPTGLYETPPAGAATTTFTSQYQGVPLNLPFPFLYWGASYSTTWIVPEGYTCFGLTSAQAANAGQWTNGLLQSVTQSNTWDGMVAPHWDGIYYGTVHSWTAGSAPNRRFIISWENFTNSTSTAEHLYFQVRLFEGTNKIQFAYRPDTTPSSWVLNRYNCGMVAPGVDPRWIAATTDNNVQTGHPATDYEFSPRLTHYTGTLVYDRPIPTAAGIPATPTADVPLGGVRLELRFTDGTLNAFTYANADGTFDIPGIAVPFSTTGDIWAVAASQSCVVKDGAQQTPAVKLAAGVSLVNGAAVGTLRASAAVDPNATFRAPAAIASAIQRANVWAQPLTSDPIPTLTVVYDATSSLATSYAAGSSPTLKIAGPAAANPDMWDEPVVMRAYARHVIASIAAPQSVLYDDRFDAVTDAENAFGTAFGCYVWAAATGGRTFVDGTGALSATTFDLEDPQPTTRKGADVAAWVAAALYDALDPANEPHDKIDGSGAAAVPFQTVDALAAPATVDRFYRAWALQRDAFDLSRSLIRHGVVSDDADEPNDLAAEATPLGGLGVRRNAMTLEIHNEDWFSVTPTADVVDLLAEVNYPSLPSQPGARLEVYDAAGALLGFKTETGGAGPIAVSVGPRPAGTYRVRFRHLSGDPIPAYSVQVGDRIALAQTQLKAWTVGRFYDDAIPLTGGIRPYSFSIQPPTSAAPGLGVDAVNLRVTGTPSKAGTYDFALVVQDGGSPLHGANSTQHLVINPPLDMPMAEFVGFAADKPLDVALPRVGGTAPFVFSIDSGALPAGTTFDAAAFRLTGAAAAPGGAKVVFAGSDVAGSLHDEEVTVVGCVPLVGRMTSVDLAAGDSACGLYVDAVQGSALTFAVSTAKGAPRRTLRAGLVGSDGQDVAGAVVKGGVGKASAARATAKRSGRYFFALGSPTGELTHLVGSFTVKPPTKGKGSVKPLAGGATFDVEFGALAGATLTFTTKPDARSGLALNVVSVFDPDGATVPFDALVKTKGKTTTLTGPLGKGGTWTIRVRASGPSAGSATWSYSIKEPKNGTYSAD